MFFNHCKNIDEFAKTTPFNRMQLYDLYTKFKSLSMLTIYNKDTRYVKKEKKHLIMTKRTGGDSHGDTRRPARFPRARARARGKRRRAGRAGSGGSVRR